MLLKPHTTIGLEDLHKKLNVTQSTFGTSIRGIPRRLHFIGMLIAYEELQMVQWQREVLFTITTGGVESLKISMLLNEENPIGLRQTEPELILGRIFYFKNVQINSFDFTDCANLEFYGVMNPPSEGMHTILSPVTSGGNCVKFLQNLNRFLVNPDLSVIPSGFEQKPALCTFPHLIEDQIHLTPVLHLLRVFHTCILQNVNFSKPKNPFQQFISTVLKSHDLPLNRMRRRSKLWLTSYSQYIDWYNRCKNKNQSN